MPLFTDLPATPEQRRAKLEQALSDPSRCVVLGNQFDYFDYNKAKEGIGVYVEDSFGRITSIVSDMTGGANGDTDIVAGTDPQVVR